jgi:hypothetical protein
MLVKLYKGKEFISVEADRVADFVVYGFKPKGAKGEKPKDEKVSKSKAGKK